MPFFLILICLFSSLWADELTVDPPKIWEANCDPCCRPPADCIPCLAPPDDSVVVDLMNPIYENGVLTTTEGGVLSAEGLRIQAKKIIYTRLMNEEGLPVFSVFCEGNLLIDYKEWVLVGDALFYDFATHTGYLINGRTASPPWYVGGAKFYLNESSIEVIDGYVTTSEGQCHEVVFRSPRLTLTRNRILTASNLNLRVKNIPLFWFPKLELDLKNIDRSPLAVKFGWGGFLGSYLSLLYRFPDWREFFVTARLDAFFGHGLGGGIETAYDPACRPTRFFTRNYFAKDIAIFDPEKRDRYRFQGTFYDRFYGITIDGMYDFVSDAEMATDYQTRDFDLYTAGRTQIEWRKQESSWIASLFTRVRVNDFQSVNQELPYFFFQLHPFEIPYSGVIFENTFKAGFLSYVFSDEVKTEKDFHSGRIAAYPRAYRPFNLGEFTLTPEAGFIGVAYSNAPSGSSAGLALGDLALTLETAFTKETECWKHVVEPYAQERFLTAPSVPVSNHYIFTIQDGLARLNMLRFGARSSFFTKTPYGLKRPLWFDLWANAFFDSGTIHPSIPKAYLNIEWQPTERIFIASDAGWNFEHQQLDFYNTRIDFTAGPDLAFGVEYRHRSRYDWRKADFYNFILENVRSEEALLTSALSDRRSTFLFRTFLRPSPDWTIKFDLRSGWGRENKRPDQNEGPYLEYQVELGTILFERWRLAFNFEHRESDNRSSVSLRLNPGPPPRSKACGATKLYSSNP